MLTSGFSWGAGRKQPINNNNMPRSPSKKSSLKRKADDSEHRANSKPLHSYSVSKQHVRQPRVIKKSPTNNKKQRTSNTIQGRPLPMSRLLNSLDKQTLASLLENICSTHPDISKQISALVPTPSVSSSLFILKQYVETIYANFPFKVDQHSDYAYIKVKPYLDDFYQALSDFTLNFLPPNESNPNITLAFLDGAVDALHKLPNWDEPALNCHKSLAYEELSNTMCLIIPDLVIKSGPMILITGDWENKLQRHDELSGNKFENVLQLIKLESQFNVNNNVENNKYFHDLGTPSKIKELVNVNFSQENSPLGHSTASSSFINGYNY